MALKINQSGTFRWPVSVSIPKDGGGFDKATFDAVFKRSSRTEVEELGNKVMAGELSGLEAVKSILVGWHGVVDGDQEVPFSETNRDRVLDIPGVAVALFRSFTDANNGAAQAKN